MSFRREAHVPKGGPDGGDGGNGGDVYPAGRPQRRVAARVPRPPAPAGRRRARTARARSATARAGADLVVPVPEGTRREDPRRRAARRPRAPRRHATSPPTAAGAVAATPASSRTRAARPSFAEQGEYGEEHWLRLEVKLHGRRRARRVPERREVHADLGGERGEAQDRRLPVHHARAQPRRRALPRPRVRRSPTSPASSRARPRARASATSSSATSSGPASWCSCSTCASVEGSTPEEQERGPARRARALPAASCSSGRGSSSGTKADVATARRSTARAISAVTHDGLDELLGRLGTLVDEARAAEPEPRAVRRAPPGRRGLLGASATTTARGGSPVAPPSASSRWPTSRTSRRSRTCRTGSARWASSGRWRKAGAREGDIVRIGAGRARVRRGHLVVIAGRGREGRHVVDHPRVGRARRRRAAEAVPARSSRPAGRGHEVVLVCSGAIAAGPARARHAASARPTSARCRPSPRSGSPG